jgi:DNA-directed RNA polymerase sigma subunit (sigma70/sigma32)
MVSLNPMERMASKDDRPRISELGEWYEDLLTVDSQINRRSEAQQAASLLCAKLQERESKIKERVRYLAAKRGVTFEEMWLQILKGGYQKMTSEELAELNSILPME